MNHPQLRLLKYIISYTDKNLIGPSYDDIKFGLGLSSKGQIGAQIASLQSAGWILQNGSRDFTILKRPGVPDPYSTDVLAAMNPAKLEKLAMDILLIQDGRRVAA